MAVVLISVKFVLGVLSNGASDFESTVEIYEAVGELLQEVSSNKTKEDIM